MRALACLLGALGVAVVAAACAASAVARTTPLQPAVRDCKTSAYGQLAADWMTRSVVSGPIGFIPARGYADAAPDAFASVDQGRYRGTKLLVVVRTGWVTRLVVPTGQREAVALQYVPRDFNKVIVPADGRHDIALRACLPGRPRVGPRTARWTQFTGAIVVAGPRCVTLELFAAKAGRTLPIEPQFVSLSFGAGEC